MGQDPDLKDVVIHSRRTGIDRRWIPSSDRTPERRRGIDRRMQRRQTFLEPFDDTQTQPGHQHFPEIDNGENSSPSHPAVSDGDHISAFAPGQTDATANTRDPD